MHSSNKQPSHNDGLGIDMLPVFNHSTPSLLSSLGWLRTSRVQWKVGLVSSRRLLLYALFHAFRRYSHHLAFMATNEVVALQMVNQCSPNVLILTPDLEQGNGKDLAQKASQLNHDLFIILVVDLDIHDRELVLSSGADAILTEWELFSGDNLNQIVLALLNQRRYRSQAIESFIQSMPPNDAVSADPNQGLTKREVDVAKLLLKGANDREIADCLSMGYNTVRSHGRSLRKKMGTKNRSQLLLKLQNIISSNTVSD
jgi:DNA-binding NarL/FixJ family response regulator